MALLVKSFRRKLTFTVGYSVVRGRDNCIVWNGVHHKTNPDRGSTAYGYPDDTYFNRLKQELALKGVTHETPEEAYAEVDEVTLNVFRVTISKDGKETKAKKAYS